MNKEDNLIPMFEDTLVNGDHLEYARCKCGSLRFKLAHIINAELYTMCVQCLMVWRLDNAGRLSFACDDTTTISTEEINQMLVSTGVYAYRAADKPISVLDVMLADYQSVTKLVIS